MRKTWSKPKHDLLGRRFGRLIAVELVPRVDLKHGFSWKCKCDCGEETTTRAQHLLCGATKSCGCLFREKRAAGLARKHGLYKTPEYQTWRHMISRCDPTYIARADYYDRGIRVCPEWGDKTAGFETFLKYLRDTVGMHPGKGMSFDRINNDKGYEPGNVRWATRQEQTDNRRQPICKEKLSEAEFAVEAAKRGYSRGPHAEVFRAVTISANAPAVGSIITVDCKTR